MKLSDYKGDEALDLLADIIEPFTYIFADKEIQALAKKRAAPIKYVSPALKNHKEEVYTILARINQVPVEEYKKNMSIVEVPMQLMSLFTTPEIRSLFTSQSQTISTSEASSGSATESTEAKEN